MYIKYSYINNDSHEVNHLVFYTDHKRFTPTLMGLIKQEIEAITNEPVSIKTLSESTLVFQDFRYSPEKMALKLSHDSYFTMLDPHKVIIIDMSRETIFGDIGKVG